MKIKQGCKLREIAGENVVIMQGRQGADFTQIITLNDSAVMLWNAVEGKEFTVEDAAKALTDNFEVDEATALQDAERWVAKMKECGLVE